LNAFQLGTPVVFIIYRRSDLTARVFAEIRRAKPPKLLVIADGPGVDRPGDPARCQATRAVIDKVDWDCEVIGNYSEVNLGCKVRVASGLDWAFNTVEEAIILEDDCVPHPTFFRFCQELLDKYRSDERVMMISGDNFGEGCQGTENSYYFSRSFHMWGWASWRRAWRNYDLQMALWPSLRGKDRLTDLLSEPRLVNHWQPIFDDTYSGKIDTWDYQWQFAGFVQGGLSIMPAVNLVSNIGMGQDATHTKVDTGWGNLPTAGMKFPLKHPNNVCSEI
jgi:hypothetical protein